LAEDAGWGFHADALNSLNIDLPASRISRARRIGFTTAPAIEDLHGLP
jgi:hypothetical protein